MAFGISASTAAIVGGGLSLAGSLYAGSKGAGAASSAADAQQQSATEATAEQRRQYDLTRQDALDQYKTARSDNAPFLKNGTAANERLAQLLGISKVGSKAAVASAPTGKVIFKGQAYDSEAALRKVLVDDYVRQGGDPNLPNYQVSLNNVMSEATPEMSQAQDAVEGTEGDGYGSLLTKFSDSTEGAPYGARFTTADLNADPVYQSGLQFGLNEGTKGINARAIAGGGYDSGATLRALTQFGNDYGSTKANESYARFTADKGNAYNRFTNDQNNAYAKLTGGSSTGQTAVANVTNAGQNMVSTVAGAGQNATNNISNDITGAGNARAAGIVGGAQAWGGAASGINSAYNSYQSNQTLQALLKRNSGLGPQGDY